MLRERVGRNGYMLLAILLVMFLGGWLLQALIH